LEDFHVVLAPLEVVANFHLLVVVVVAHLLGFPDLPD
jgi:hypothetical protein